MKRSQLWLAASMAGAGVLLTACGGGGGGGTDSALVKNEVSASSGAVVAGASLSVSALATMRGATPSEMKWTITPLSQSAQGEEQPTIADADCAAASYVAPANPNLSGQGACSTVITFPDTMPEGRWRITNVARAQGGAAVAGSVDIYVQPVPDNGFRLLEPSAPVTGYVNRQVQLNVPFTANSGARIENVRYEWSADEANPAVLAIAGARNSIATVVPSSAGQYKFNLKVTATVNGIRTERNASVVVIATAAPYQDVIEAGRIQTAAPGEVVELVGNVLNRNDQFSYTYAWTQLPGTEGGPERVTLANRNSQVASFIAPNTPGTYGFEFAVTRQNLDGSTSTTRAQTYAVVRTSGLPFFNLSLSQVQAAQIGQPVTLAAGITDGDSSGAVRYTYRWRQVGSSPATVTLSGANTSLASFVPAVAGTYTFELEVTGTNANGGAITVTSQTQVVASDAPGAGGGSLALSADAGNAQVVQPNTVVSLSGDYSAAGDTTGATFSYAWAQVGATPTAVTLSNANSQTASFIASTPGTYDFELTVTARLANGSTQTASSRTQVLVSSSGGKTFTVSAGDAQVATVGTAVVLNGDVSLQGTYSGETIAYQWSLLSGPATVTISNANAATASFIGQTPGLYEFQLQATVTENGVPQSKTATTQVLVQ